MLYVAEMDFSTFDQKAVLVRTNPLVMLVGVAVFVLISVVIYWCMERVVNKKSAKWIITVIVIAVHVVLSVIWIMINPLQPDSDQGMVWKAAVELANEGKISNVWYFTRYPFQAGMLYPMDLLIQQTGSTNPIVWRLVNVFAVALIDFGIIIISGELCADKRDQASSVAAIIVFFSIPVVVYSTYVYGTLLSLALVIWAMYGTIKLFANGNAAWSILPILFLPIANRLYSGTLIATIAIVLAIVVEILTEKKFRLIAVVLLVGVGYILSGKLLRHQLYLDTGIEESVGGVPATAYIYMGITAEDAVAGPGSYDESSVELYEKYGESTSEKALELDAEIVSEYVRGIRNPRFFWEKSVHQWSDPLFSSLSLTVYYFDRLSENFKGFILGRIPQNVYSCSLRFFNAFIYLMACIGGLYLLGRKKCSSAMLIFILYFVGGFTFYFFWEAKSRYALPYFVCLYPLAVYGVINLVQEIPAICGSMLEKKFLGIVIIEIVIIIAVSIGITRNDVLDFEIEELYSDKDGRALNYIDSEYNDDDRVLHSEEIKLDRGIYDFDVVYASDFPTNQFTGARIYLKSNAGNTVFYDKAEYGRLNENGQTSFTVFIPRNNYSVEIKAFMDTSEKLVVPEGRIGYFLINRVAIHKNNGKMCCYLFARLTVIVVLINLIWLITKLAIGKNVPIRSPDT